MTESTIACPQCSHKIELTSSLKDSLAAPLLADAQKQFEERLALKDTDIEQREASLREQQQAIKAAQQAIDKQVEEKLDAERANVAKQEADKAKRAAQLDIQAEKDKAVELQELLSQRDQKLEEARKQQADFLKQQRALEEKEREVELTIQKQVTATLGQERTKMQQEVTAASELKLREKEEQMESMKRTIEELKKKGERGSQQLQGEVVEMQLEEELQARFSHDVITPVPKGEHGGDVLQTVCQVTGIECGKILWETKRTKNWTEGWLSKLRDDQRAAKAEIALMMSYALPADVQTFDQRDGVWICAPQYAVPLVTALRHTLLEVANSKQSQVGQKSKMELVYAYLTGPQFRHRVEAIIEKFDDMQADLVKEKRFTQKQWAKRETQMQGVLDSTIGMYGDLQGIAGKALQEIDGLDVPLLEADEEAA